MEAEFKKADALYQVCSKARLVSTMYNILLCDDDSLFLERLQKQVSELSSQANVHVKIYSYNYLEQISDYIIKSCDIAILDIDFEGRSYSGLDIAKRLRLFRRDAVIIFATNYLEYAPEGYEVQAFRYLLKKDLGRKLRTYFSQALQYLDTNSETFKFQINGEIIDIPLSNILYFEAQLHTVKVYVQQNTSKTIREYSFYSSIGKLEQYLSDKGFLRIHKSYLVNMAHIQCYQFQKVQLLNGIELKASAKRYAEQKEKYLLWKGYVINGPNC